MRTHTLRRWLLITAPAPIVALAMGVSHFAKSNRAAPASHNHAAIGAGELALAPPFRASTDDTLRTDCLARAEELRKRLGEGCEVIERVPFVLAGDMTAEELDRWHKQTIGPAARAMAHVYFRAPPDRPITVLLFRGEQSYNHYAKHLYGEEGISIYGYYKPAERTLVMNIATGGGTLVHELTHALMAFDFPTAPDWFNEGLASLHEQCHIRPDETGIDGLVNWRLPGLQEAIRKERLPSLEALVSNKDFRGRQVGLNYAQARYFCLYMQEQHLLAGFYSEFRDSYESDPTGAKTIKRVFPIQTWAELDKAFQAWAMKLERP